MANPDIKELAEQLLEQSKAHKVNWEDTRAGGEFRVFFPDLALRLSRVLGIFEDESAEYKLELTSNTGRSIDSLIPEPGAPLYQLLSDIFTLAEEYIHDNSINKALDYLKSS